VRRFFRDNATFLVAIFLLLAARSSLADHYVVPSGSMEATLKPGDRVFVDKHAYGLRVPFTSLELADTGAPQRGDVVIFPSPADGVRLVKRVVAVGGDVVEVRGGRVRVNGTFAASDDAGEHERLGAREFALKLEHGGGPDQAPVRVPDGHVFVLGDARGNSRDSRFFGFVREDSIYARASSVYFRRGDGFVWYSL
jgi:signal peptidase I